MGNEVLEFIHHFLDYPHYASVQTLKVQFRFGYSYHFASLLKKTFDRGEVCWIPFINHFVWVDHNDIAYDVDGIYEDKEVLKIPEKYLSQHIYGFKRIPNIPFGISDENALEVIRTFCNTKNIGFNEDNMKKCFKEEKINDKRNN